MKVKVGYITSWRRAIFFTLILAIILFGTVSTLCTTYLGASILTNIISVGVLVLCIGGFILVLADKMEHYEGIGNAVVEDGHFLYNDKKRHIDLLLSEIKKVDIQNILLGREGSKPLAYRLLIQTEKRKYYIESERAFGLPYQEVDLHRLYLFLQEKTAEVQKDM